MNKLTTTLCALFLTGITSFGQTVKIDNVSNISSSNSSGVIRSENKIEGYYVFYQKGKMEGDKLVYEIETFDDNLRPSKNFEITRTKGSYLIEMSYNGSAFLMHFYDQVTGYEFITFTPSGDRLGSLKIELKDLNPYELSRSTQIINSTDGLKSFHPLGTKGFVRSTYAKSKKMGYELVAYDNNLKEVWSLASDEKSKMIELMEVAEVSENIIVGSLVRKKNLMDSEMDLYTVLINAKTGRLLNEISLNDEKVGNRSLLKVSINESKKKIALVGQYYRQKNNMITDQSEGLFIQEFDLSGNVTSFTKYNWTQDIDKLYPAIKGSDPKKPYHLFFHDVVFTSDGSMHLIAEQYMQKALLSGSNNASIYTIRLGNLLVLEIDSNKKLKTFREVEKKHSTLRLTHSYGGLNTTLLGFFIKSSGAFDYAFTNKDENSDKIEVVYLDAGRTEDNSIVSDMKIGVLTFSADPMEISRVPLSIETNQFWLRIAKPGYVNVCEYNKKENTAVFRLEQLN